MGLHEQVISGFTVSCLIGGFGIVMNMFIIYPLF